MNVVRGLLLALAVGAVAGGLWFAAVVASGWSLWLLAPLVGFAVGMGMTCFGTHKVDLGGKVLAGFAALATIVTVRVFAVSHVVSAELAVTEEDAIEAVAADVAAHMESQGVSDVYTVDGGYSHGVYVAAEREWERMSADEKADKVAAVEADVEEFRGFLTPLALVFDFGIFGTLWTIASVLACVKAASATNEPKEEEAPVDAGGLAGVMSPGGLRGLPPPQAESPSESVLPGMPPPPPGQGPLGRIGDKRDPGQRDRAAA